MKISDKFRKTVVGGWFGSRELLFEITVEEVKTQYSMPGLLSGERATFLKAEAREQLEREIRNALEGNDSPHIFLKVLERVEPNRGEIHDHLVFVNW